MTSSSQSTQTPTNAMYNALLKETHSLQLHNFLIKELKGRRNFIKMVLNKDELANTFSKHFQKTNFIFIINLGVSSKANNHWVLLYNEIHQPLIYFDSHGATKIPNDIQNILNQIPTTTNTNRLQSGISLICGQYALFFSYCLYYKIATFNKLLTLFNKKNLLLNDLLITHIII